MVGSEAVAGTRKEITREIHLRGLVPLMYDRYPGDNSTKLDPWQKFNFSRKDGRTIIMPALNIMSFLSAQNTPSAPKRLLDKRKYRETANGCLSFALLSALKVAGASTGMDDEFPLLRDGKPIKLDVPTGDFDDAQGVYIHRCVARLKDGIPNPKVRPTLQLPWALRFRLTLLPNGEVQEQMVKFLFDRGGLAIGLGTFRGVFGKFEIADWLDAAKA